LLHKLGQTSALVHFYHMERVGGEKNQKVLFNLDMTVHASIESPEGVLVVDKSLRNNDQATYYFYFPSILTLLIH
jgi:hypothetical protein